MAAFSTTKLHFQSPSAPNTAIVTLDIVDATDPANSAPLCFCGDCFLEDELTPPSAAGAPPPPTRMRRILSHVEPSTNIPRNLLYDVQGQLAGVSGEIPWCREVTAAGSGISTGHRSPPCVFNPVHGSSSDPAGAAKAAAIAAIDGRAEGLDSIAQELWAHPELNYAETFAHGYITDYLESQGTTVERGYCGLPTSFRAQYDTGRPGPTVTICCEYDALPGIGHACGHNLIAEATVSGFVGAKTALEEGQADGITGGSLVIIGTPAEEGACGKVELIKRGGFDDCDLAMMVHPGPGYTLYTAGSAMESVKITYTGKNAHAAGAPWDGVNALNAVIQAFNNVDAMRQQMKPSWRVHGIITQGGLKPNIIPDECCAEWYIRALNVSDVKVLRSKVEGCFQGAALSTGCELAMEWLADTAVDDWENGAHLYANMVSNGPMCEAFRENWAALGQPEWASKESDVSKQLSGGGSTDMGNVSHLIPSIHPSFKIDTKFGNHHPGFTEYTIKPHNLETARVAGKAVAMTSLDLLASPELVAAARSDWEAAQEKRDWSVEMAM